MVPRWDCNTDAWFACVIRLRVRSSADTKTRMSVMAWRTMRSCVVANKLRVRGRVVVAYKQYRYVVNQRLKCDANLGQLGTRGPLKSGSR